MKTLALLPILAMFVFACSNTDTTSDPVADLSAKTQMVMKSDWKVSSYLDSGKDETSDFSGYRFAFNTDGTFVATLNSSTFNGSWTLLQGSTKPDDSGNLSNDDKLAKLTITISGNKQMDNLSHKWLVDKITDSEIWLRDDNPLSAEVLKFNR